MIPDPITGVSNLLTSIVSRVWPDKTKVAEFEKELETLEKSGQLETLANRFGVIQAEARSSHFLTATWRPITMLTFVAIIANNYIIYPYLSLFWPEAPTLEIPPDMWALLKIGLGGYVVGRSVEKTAEAFKK